jgi:hypothetical protein
MYQTTFQGLALALVIASGCVHARWTGRWSPPRELNLRVSRLAKVPHEFGGWKGRDIPLDRRSVAVAGLAGYLFRRYEDAQGHSVLLLIVCGPPGPISVHTPEVCYGGLGYEPIGDRSLREIGTGDAVWRADFLRIGPAMDDRLRILYGWSVDGTWRASSSPRSDFAGAPVLCKLYIVRELPRTDHEEDPSSTFAKALFAQLRGGLFESNRAAR